MRCVTRKKEWFTVVARIKKRDTGGSRQRDIDIAVLSLMRTITEKSSMLEKMVFASSYGSVAKDMSRTVALMTKKLEKILASQRDSMRN